MSISSTMGECMFLRGVTLPSRIALIVVGGMSKTFAITGWRLGFVFAPDVLALAVRKAHDYITICAPTPLQAAAVTAMELPESYYTELTEADRQRRDTLMEYLAEAGFDVLTPQARIIPLLIIAHCRCHKRP